MQIVVTGDLDRAREKQLNFRRFRCSDCGCEWIASNKEYHWGDQREPGPYMDCPCCGKRFVDAMRY